MPIRLPGLNSGMDTDAMVQQLVKASSVKKDNMVKAQTRLKWQQDTWKDLNAKVYSFFNNYLDNMQFSPAYNKKTTSVADPTIATVSAGNTAVNGSQSLAVQQLAKSAYMTGGKIAAGMTVTSSTTMKEMGLVSGAENATMAVTVDGRETTIVMTANMTMNQLLAKMNEGGINVNFDETNQRLFINAKKSGSTGNFEITAKDAAGDMALSILGLSGSAATDADTLAWAAMKSNADATADDIKAGTDFQARVTTESDRRIGVLQDTRDALQRGLDNLKASSDYQWADSMGSATLTLDDKIKDLQKQYREGKDTFTEDEKKQYVDGIKALQDAKKRGTDIEKQDALLTSESKAKLRTTVENEYVAKVNTAYKAMQTPTGERVPVKLTGQDAIIELNGVAFTSNSNTFNINGMAITAQNVSAKDASDNYIQTTVNTSDDVDGIYDMVKEFITEYNKLIKEMDTLYNASSSKGYEPLTKEEKEAMSDKEVEEWEKKIKDSILRRDGTLGSVSSLLRTSMMESVEIGGKKVSLMDFGIELPSFFNAEVNDRNMYHIAGDKKDSVSSGQKDKLRKAIAGDPEKFREFFTKFSQNMYGTLNKEMRSVKDMRSIYHIYDDKRMDTEYKDFGEEIKEQERRLKSLEDKYYKQFAAMEKAMSQLNSQQSALASMLGQ